MYETAAKLLAAASEMIGGDKALAQQLGISESLLSRLKSGRHELPERVLLGTVDIILANHEARDSFSRLPAVQPVNESTRDG